MSWSFYFKGTPQDAKVKAAEAFANAMKSTESVPAEQKTVAHAAEIVGTALDELITSEYAGVSIEGFGSGCTNNPGQWKGCVAFNLKITPLQVLA